MRRRARLLELLDRKIVDAQHLDAAIDEMFRARLGDADVVLMEFTIAPQPRVRGLDQDAHVFGEIRRRELVGPDPAPRQDLDHARAAHQHLERQRVDARALVEEVTRRVDVRAGVGAHVHRRHVRAPPARHSLRRFEVERDVPGIRWEAGVERDRDIDQLHDPERNRKRIWMIAPFDLAGTDAYDELFVNVILGVQALCSSVKC